MLPKYKTVLFVHGCFWHRHKGCRYTTHPATREEFWASKFERNMQRDLQVRTELEALGWDVGVIWECQTRAAGDLEAAIARLLPPRKATRSAPPKVHEESAQAT